VKVMSVQHAILAAEKRAEDLRKLLSYNPARLGGGSSVLSHFEQLSQQLDLLQGHGTDASARAILERQFVVPSRYLDSTDGPMHGVATSAIPGLLGTLLDKEQEESAPSETMLQRETLSGHTEPTLETIRLHNERLAAALEHLASRARRADLPGAANMQDASMRQAKRFTRGQHVPAQPAAAAGTEALQPARQQQLVNDVLTALRSQAGPHTQAKREAS
jgi:hypothetical protein